MEATVTFSDLLAEAIGAPEPGALNFSALQQLIQAILRKLRIENELINQNQTDVPQNEPAVEEEQQVVDESGDKIEDEMVPVVRFEESKAYQSLLASVCELQENVADLKQLILEQKRISDEVLPTVEELDQFRKDTFSSLHSDCSQDAVSLASRLDRIDDTLGRLTALGNDAVLEYARVEKSLQPFLDGGELAIIRAQLDNINQLLKVHFPGYRSHCSSMSVLRQPRPSNVDEVVVPVNFYQHPPPDTLRARQSRRSTIKHQPEPDLEKELDTIRAVLTSVIARLPLSGAESDPSTAVSSHSFEQAANNIRSIWQREIEELLQSNNERIEALESAQEKHGVQLDGIGNRTTSLEETVGRLSAALESYRETIAVRTQELEETFGQKLAQLDERCSRKELEIVARLNELEHEVENRVDFEHFRTRLSKDTFHKALEEIQSQMDARVEQFMGDLKLIWAQLNEISTGVQVKCDRDELERTETRFRRRLTFTQLMVHKIRETMQRNVEAAGTKVRLGPEPLRCVSCNHEATMQALADTIPTGKGFRAAEKQREQRMKELNELAATIALEHTKDQAANLGQQRSKSTRKAASMIQPDSLAYKVYMKK